MRHRRPSSMIGGSENLFDDVHGPIRSDFAAPDSEQMVQECVLRIGSLEAKPRAEVRRARGSIVPDAVECRMNERAILRLQREARVELEHTVRPFDGPIAAAGQDLATQTRAFEGTSDDGKSDAPPVRDGTDVLGGGRGQTKGEERLK